jgi:hypothetical protein
VRTHRLRLCPSQLATSVSASTSPSVTMVPSVQAESSSPRRHGHRRRGGGARCGAVTRRRYHLTGRVRGCGATAAKTAPRRAGAAIGSRACH